MPGGTKPIGYRGRFAPSPTGPLHAGSLVAALASWLDARAHGGQWLVRIEDIDTPRCAPGVDALILAQLAALGLEPDAPPIRQSSRSAPYQQALVHLLSRDLAYPCGCTRAEIAAAQPPGATRERHAELVYPGTCRDGLHGKPARAVRMRTGGTDPILWQDRWLGTQQQDVEHAVGDFVLKRADQLWAYQLAVVVDDAAQGITHVVRGADLADNTPRQILLQRALGLATPRYLHTPLVLGADGDKLSKQNGAEPLDTREPLAALNAAARVLGLRIDATDRDSWLRAAVAAWHGGWHDVESIGPSRPDFSASSSSTTGIHTMMTTTASGLQFEDTVPGTGATAQAGQQVSVHYTGWLYSNGVKGAKFDSSKDRNDPFGFSLGAGMVIRGWDEGVQGMQVGGTRVLVIPPELGYGARGAGGVIPPNATLMFEVELLAV